MILRMHPLTHRQADARNLFRGAPLKSWKIQFLKEGEASAIGCAAEQWSCTSPGARYSELLARRQLCRKLEHGDVAPGTSEAPLRRDRLGHRQRQSLCSLRQVCVSEIPSPLVSLPPSPGWGHLPGCTLACHVTTCGTRPSGRNGCVW